MTDTNPMHVRLLESGLTVRGSVTRRGQALKIEQDEDVFAYFDRTESEQREAFGSARWEHITAEQYAEAQGAPSVAPEPAQVKPTPQTPPPPEDGAQRESNRAAPSSPSHTPPAKSETPDPGTGADPEAARWPWYTDANAETTLGRVAEMGETEAQDFLAYEQGHKARKSVINPMMGNV